MNQVLVKVQRYKWWLLFALLLGVGLYGVYKPLPPELGMVGSLYELPDAAVRFLVDETYTDVSGAAVMEQEIFTEIFTLIAEAESYILVDMFLWNAFQGAAPETHRLLSDELTNALIAKKIAQPDMHITVISDPINTVYGGQSSPHFTALRAAGIPVIVTDVTTLRDSNPLYSALWRTLLQWFDVVHQAVFGRSYTVQWAPNLLNTGGEPVTLRAYLTLLNFKANHRKLIVADAPATDGRTLVSVVSSANPHDGSSRHSNVAIRVEGGIWRDIVRSEQMVVDFSDGGALDVPQAEEYRDASGPVSVGVLTERSILDNVLTLLDGTTAGDTVDLAMFYLSEEAIIAALIAASERGVMVRVILDPNKDAFGREKNGIPNRPVAATLVRESGGRIAVRWCATTGEQCHGKMLLARTATGAHLLLGSANFTRRNLNNLNLETNVFITSVEPSQAYLDATAYFNRMWHNEDGRRYTHEYAVYQDERWSSRLQSWFMENTGLSTF